MGLVIAACVVLGIVLPNVDNPPSSDEDKAACTYNLDDVVPTTLATDVKVTVTPATGVVNFGASRGVRALDVLLQTSEPVDDSVAKALSLTVPRRLYRNDAKLTTVAVKPLSFSPPKRLSPREIAFTVCIDGSDLQPGSYSGTISIIGPDRLQAQSLGMTVNAKNGDLFGWVLPVALFLSFLLLILKGSADRTDRVLREAVEGGADANALRGQTGRDFGVLTDLGWWLATLVVLALGLAAGYAVYSDNLAWGSDALASVIAVAGAVFAPAGLRAVLSPR